jgi:hypothetical protein
MSSPFLSVFVLSVMLIFMLCSLTVCRWEEHRLRVFVNKVRRILGREMAEGRRQFNEEFHNMHSSQNIVRINKSRRMRWELHVARVGEICAKSWLESLNGRELRRRGRRWK